MVIIRKAAVEDKKLILELHRYVARVSQGIAHTEPEITEQYVDNLFNAATNQGLMLIAVNTAGQIVAEIHASKYGLRIFDHILTGLTIAVHPDYQGKGIGKMIFRAFLEKVQQMFPEVSRIELESRASNQKSIGLYRSLGFVQEGRMKHKTRNMDGSFDDSLLMAWTKPGFSYNT